MMLLFSVLLCLTSGLELNEENALARANKLLRKEHEVLVKALDAITKETAIGAEEYSYSIATGGKCMTLDGKDPKYEYFGGKGSECEKTCDERRDCFGYSISGYDNCLIWLQRDIMGGGEEWGGADCHTKDLKCSGNVGDDYNCVECYDGDNGKYLWGNTCYAKDFGADTYTKGVCGNEYKCFTKGEDIGECPYGEYCPSKTSYEVALGAEACDSYCEGWSDFKDSKKDKSTQEEICGMYKSTRCSTCEEVQAYCGWKKVTEKEEYSYSVAEGGKCMTLDGKDPKYEYFGGKGSECEKTCDERRDCFGYSISGYDNCLIWLQRDIMGGGEEWGGADCHVKDIQCSGNVGDDYNCFECYDGYNGKYLWGNTCYAKDFGADTYTKGVCGNEYKCFKEGTDIGECPYDGYCPSKTSYEVALGAEACDSYCEGWSDFKDSKKDKSSQEEICGMYKSTRCSTCQEVQAYCGWKKVTEKEEYSYSVATGGKCMTMDGKDPKYEYFGGKGSECEKTCDERRDCFGYSISGYDNCLIWLQRDIMGGGDEWGGADCHIKDLQCSGNVNDDYNCFECYNAYNSKYLWGYTCYAKNWGEDTYSKGKCGNEYKCFTNNEDIGDCPYDSYCPSA